MHEIPTLLSTVGGVLIAIAAAFVAVQLIMVLLSGLISALTRRSPQSGERPFILTNEPPPGEVRTITYRTRDGTADYQFRIIRFVDGNYRIYITSQPGYRGRSEDGHSTHRYYDKQQGYYICWSVPITSYEDALTIAARWSEKTQEYQRTGKKF